MHDRVLLCRLVALNAWFLPMSAMVRASAQVANPPLVGVLTGIAVGLTPVGSVLFDPASATAQVTAWCSRQDSDLPPSLLRRV